MRAPLTYDRYTELLSRRIQRTVTPAELEAIAQFQAAQPPHCPRCGVNVFSFILPDQVVHDIAHCEAKPIAPPG